MKLWREGQGPEALSPLPHVNHPREEFPLHWQRWLTAIIAVPILLLVLLLGGRILFVLMIVLISGLGQWEFIGMFKPESDWVRKLYPITLGTILILSFWTIPKQAYPINPIGPVMVLVFCLFGLLLFYLLSYGHIEKVAWSLAVNALGLLYLPLLLGHLVWLRFMAQGEWWVLWLLAVIFAGDTTAFYSGKAWGEKKLYPQVSPGKTWVGTAGGLAACLVVGILLGRQLFPQSRTVSLAWLSLLVGLLGLVGDLFESMLKRQARVKDAGSLLPGHGGMLDRLDSLLFAVPVVVYVRLFLFGT
ncbi:MAG: phosphatidate cytidylyltransferase [Thermodesulfobacteriota bacterium]